MFVYYYLLIVRYTFCIDINMEINVCMIDRTSI